MKDNYNIFNLKLPERGAGSSFNSFGSAINCVSHENNLHGIDPNDPDYIQDDCGDNAVQSLFMYKICQSEFQFPHRLFVVDLEDTSMTRE